MSFLIHPQTVLKLVSYGDAMRLHSTMDDSTLIGAPSMDSELTYLAPEILEGSFYGVLGC